MISQLNLTLWAWIESFRDLRRWTVWRPFLFLAVAQALGLLILTQFYREPFSWMIVPLFQALRAGAVLHYPQFYVALPVLYSQLNLIMDLVIGSFAFGVAFLLIWRLATGAEKGQPWKQARRRYGALLLVRLPLLLALVVIAWVLPQIVVPGGGEMHGNQLRLVRYGTFLAGTLIEAIFVYAPLVLLVESRSVAGAWRGALRLVGKVPLATFLAVLIPNLAQLPIGAAFRRSDAIVRNLAPELVGWMLLASILIYVFVNYFIVASAIRIYGARAQVTEATWRP